jgi:hypothetical protein
MDTVGKSEGTAPSNNKEDFRRGNLTERAGFRVYEPRTPKRGVVIFDVWLSF